MWTAGDMKRGEMLHVIYVYMLCHTCTCVYSISSSANAAEIQGAEGEWEVAGSLEAVIQRTVAGREQW